MRPPALPLFFAAAVLLAALAPKIHAQAAGPNTSEMQERASQVILTRAVPLMEQAARAADLTSTQAEQVEHLLKEQRRTLTLFLGFSGLNGEALETKLTEVLNATRDQLEAGRGAGVP